MMNMRPFIYCSLCVNVLVSSYFVHFTNDIIVMLGYVEQTFKWINDDWDFWQRYVCANIMFSGIQKGNPRIRSQKSVKTNCTKAIYLDIYTIAEAWGVTFTGEHYPYCHSGPQHQFSNHLACRWQHLALLLGLLIWIPLSVGMRTTYMQEHRSMEGFCPHKCILCIMHFKLVFF